MPARSRSRRTAPVVAVAGTTTVRVPVTVFTAVGATTCSPRLPLVSRVVNTTRSLASRLAPLRVMVCPVLAEAMPALVGVPLSAAVVMAATCELSWRIRSRLSV